MPDVTILTPSLNYERYLRDNISSVLNQTEVSVRHVIQDGASKDGTPDLLRTYGDKVDWRSEPDKGQSDALNKAFQRAEGEWIGWLNADEFYLPGGLAALIAAAERTSADVVYGDTVWVDAGGRMLRLLAQHGFTRLVLRLYGCFIASSSTIFRRSALESQPWDTDARMMMDWELYLRLAMNGARFRHLNYPVAAFRRHGDQVTAVPGRRFRDEYDRIFERYGIDPSHRRAGKWLHRIHKATSGAHLREIRARSLLGSNMRWFDNGEYEPFKRLLSRCYGGRGKTQLEPRRT
jgi:glycosyltransferase involved in cell wall biosynthesis